MPKTKPDKVFSFRLEMQEHERQLADLVGGSVAGRNILQGVGSVVSAFTQMTPTGAVFLATVTGWALSRSADELGNRIQEDPESVGNLGVLGNVLWNATLPGAVQDIKEGDFIQERIANAQEMASRIKGWANQFLP